jgi:two-component system response regulator
VRRLGAYAQAPRPDLIFLDLHMPKKDGWQFLDEIKTDQFLKRIPVIVLTSSSNQAHVNSVYDRHANCYLRKPSDWNELCRQIRLIEEFWFGLVLWPTAAEVAADR